MNSYTGYPWDHFHDVIQQTSGILGGDGLDAWEGVGTAACDGGVYTRFTCSICGGSVMITVDYLELLPLLVGVDPKPTIGDVEVIGNDGRPVQLCSWSWRPAQAPGSGDVPQTCGWALRMQCNKNSPEYRRGLCAAHEALGPAPSPREMAGVPIFSREEIRTYLRRAEENGWMSPRQRELVLSLARAARAKQVDAYGPDAVPPGEADVSYLDGVASANTAEAASPDEAADAPKRSEDSVKQQFAASIGLVVTESLSQAKEHLADTKAWHAREIELLKQLEELRAQNAEPSRVSREAGFRAGINAASYFVATKHNTLDLEALVKGIRDLSE